MKNLVYVLDVFAFSKMQKRRTRMKKSKNGHFQCDPPCCFKTQKMQKRRTRMKKGTKKYKKTHFPTH